jgi:UDP-galactopyranose mutase
MDYFTIKLSHAYPIYTIGYDHHLEIVKKYFSSINNLFLTGRQAQFRYIDMHYTVLSGVKTAEFIISGKPKDKAREIYNGEEDFY